jgi:hypothetical protein
MIRYAKTEDAAEICKIYNHYVLGTMITFEEEPVSADEMAQRIAETLQSLPVCLGSFGNRTKAFGAFVMRANALTAIRLNRRFTCAPTQLEDVSVFSCIVHCWTNCASENSILSLGA